MEIGKLYEDIIVLSSNQKIENTSFYVDRKTWWNKW